MIYVSFPSFNNFNSRQKDYTCELYDWNILVYIKILNDFVSWVYIYIFILHLPSTQSVYNNVVGSLFSYRWKRNEKKILLLLLFSFRFGIFLLWKFSNFFFNFICSIFSFSVLKLDVCMVVFVYEYCCSNTWWGAYNVNVCRRL